MTHESEGLPGIYKARQKANAAAMKDKLKLCPFCGGEAKIRDAGFSHIAVMCCDDRCDGQGLRSKDEAEAIKAWNRRVK